MARIQFDRSLCGDFAEALKREWLETNSLGGFASATVTGANTRRYHGLLMAATDPPAVRYLLLSKMEETLIAGGQRFELSTNLYSGAVHPDGYRFLAGFRLDPFPIFTFEAGGVTVEKRVFMVAAENTVVIEYACSAPGCRLEVRPLVAFRGYHDLTQANRILNGTVDESDRMASIQPYAQLPRLWLAHNARTLTKEGYWYFNFEYPIERERGLEAHEDLYCPFVLRFDVELQAPAVVVASTVRHSANESAAMKAAEIARRTSADDPLRAAAEQFIVRRGELHSVIAGYPWFTDWGRDTMIALPGLTLATSRFDVGRDILLAFAGLIDQGMLPNSFTGGVVEYGTADATLWFFEAIRQYIEYLGDVEFIRAQLYEKLKDIIAWHVRGTRHGIRVDVDGLLLAGDPSTSLTWMDARAGGLPVTPRNGKPVEIQALWYNALRFVARLAGDFGDDAARTLHEELAAKVEHSLDFAFWNERAGYYADVVDQGVQDLSLRPNQMIALSLGYCAVPADHAAKIMEAVKQHLLTPFGLRTLSPFDPRYSGRYEGSIAERDSAYHQGTVWPWLLGPYITALRRSAPEMIQPLRDFLVTRGTGQLPEIFDGDAPHEPRGCFAQAWSVAEILRVSRAG
ncbi:MAG TPA: amylo-alpha-1,6-glucosidase [Bryobacteraceae bacterium]|nr:amylo-alpha-1,6-glucosidase [Bryobacteraceae bacterium]